MDFDKSLHDFSTGIGRTLRTSEFVIFRTAWNDALEAAAKAIEQPWGHSTDDSCACRALKEPA